MDYFPYIWDVILPIDELHHFSRWLLHHQPVGNDGISSMVNDVFPVTFQVSNFFLLGGAIRMLRYVKNFGFHGQYICMPVANELIGSVYIYIWMMSSHSVIPLRHG